MAAMCMTQDALTEPRWYRQFWPWFLITPPLVAVILGVVMIVLAVSGEDTLVVDDYAKIGRTYEMQVERDRRAVELGVQARVVWQRETGVVSAAVNTAVVPGEGLVLRVIHPTREDQDRIVTLLPAITGVYRGTMPAGAIEGRRYIQLESATGGWRLTGQMVQGSDEIHLSPGAP